MFRFIVLLLFSLVTAAEATTDGDQPPMPFASWNGHVGIVFDTITENDAIQGVLTVSGVPAGGTVVWAGFVTGVWRKSEQVQRSIGLTFAGTDYGSVEPSFEDFDESWPAPVWDLSQFVIDVTAEMIGNGAYGFEIDLGPEAQGPYGTQLLVVYEHDSAPPRLIQLSLGAESLVDASSTSEFEGVGAGTGTLILNVHSGDPVGQWLDESISFNGEILLGGPNADIFFTDGTQVTSSFEFVVATTPGLNTVTVSSGGDWIGWGVAILVSNLAPTSIEEIASMSWARVKDKYR